MEILLLPLILAWLTTHKLVHGQQNIHRSIQRDLKRLNATCRPFDSCVENRNTDSLDDFACHCGEICVQYGTCCLDSPHNIAKPPKIRPTCRSMDEVKYFFMIDHCPPAYNKDSVWKDMCEEEWKGENDVMRLVPVTSLITNYNYKNYFCFRCHETLTEDFFYWNVTLGSSDYEFDRVIQESEHVSMTYDKHFETWVAPLGKFGATIPVNLTVEIPEKPRPLPVACVPDIISRCHDQWSETDAKRKCEAYMGAMSVERNGHVFKYKNVHCAICNFENVKNMSCLDRKLHFRIFKVRFSFTHLLDINPSSGDRVGKIQMCNDNFLWDPYRKRCRKLMCALPGFVVRNGKCQRP